MSSPITPVAPGTSSYGVAWKSVVIMSVDGNVAIVRDQLSMTFKMDRTNLRAKSNPPEVGEEWMVDRSYGNDWSFAMIMNKPIPLVRPGLVYSVADATERDAIPSPEHNLTVFRRDRAYNEVYDANTSTWFASPRVGLIKRVDPTTDFNFTASPEVVDTAVTVTFTLDSSRRYKLTYSTRFSQTNAGTMAMTFRYAAGASLAITSTLLMTYTPRGNGGDNAAMTAVKILPAGLSGQYTVGVTAFAGSGAGASIAYGGSSGTGRAFIVEDVGVSVL